MTMKLMLPVAVVVLLLAESAVVADAGLRRLRLVEVGSSQKDKPSSTSSQQKQQQHQQVVNEKWPFEDAADFRFLLKGSLSFPTSQPISSTTTVAPSPSGNTNVFAPTASPSQVASPTNTTEFTPTPSSTQFATHAPSTAPAGNDRSKLIQEKCGVSAEDRSAALITVLSAASDATSLETPALPQYQAKAWLDLDDEAILCAGSGQEDRVLQRYRVALIYFSLSGPQWNNCNANPGTACLNLNNATETPNHWLSASHECSWFGLSCEETPTSVDTYEAVIGINLHSTNLAGVWPSELFGLRTLTGLALNDNQIGGTLPNALADFTSLQYLDLEYNKFSGSLPELLFSLTSLLALGLGHNRFWGTVPSAIGQMSELSILFLEDTFLTGTVPTDALLNLEQLVALTLDHNFLQGSLEPLCDVVEQRRTENNNTIYLRFLYADCKGDKPKVECSCCTFCY